MILNKSILWFLPAVLVALGIFLLSTFLAFPIQVEGVGHLDKIEHSLAYFVLIVSFLLAYKKAGMLTRKKSYWLLLIACFYGMLLELVQYLFFSYRFFEWLDAGANVAGVFIGFMIFKLFDRG